MKSKQINFFYLESEIPLILNYFVENGYLLFRYKTSNCSSDDIVIKEQEYNSISEKVVLIKPDFQKEISYRFIELQGYYLVNSDNIPAIEFDMCSFKNQIISPGRLFLKSKYYSNDVFVEKGEDFINDANRLYRNFKNKFLVLNEDCKLWYVTKNVNLELSNGQLTWDNSFNKIERV